MEDERQALLEQLRQHFDGIMEAAEAYIRSKESAGTGESESTSPSEQSRIELEAAQDANRVLKSECAEWRQRAMAAKEKMASMRSETEEKIAALQAEIESLKNNAAAAANSAASDNSGAGASDNAASSFAGNMDSLNELLDKLKYRADELAKLCRKSLKYLKKSHPSGYAELQTSFNLLEKEAAGIEAALTLQRAAIAETRQEHATAELPAAAVQNIMAASSKHNLPYNEEFVSVSVPAITQSASAAAQSAQVPAAAASAANIDKTAETKAVQDHASVTSSKSAADSQPQAADTAKTEDSRTGTKSAGESRHADTSHQEQKPARTQESAADGKQNVSGQSGAAEAKSVIGDDDLEWKPAQQSGKKSDKNSGNAKDAGSISDEDLEWKPAQQSGKKSDKKNGNAKDAGSISDEDLEWKPAQQSGRKSDQKSGNAKAAGSISDEDLEWKPAQQSGKKSDRKNGNAKAAGSISDDDLEWKPAQQPGRHADHSGSDDIWGSSSFASSADKTSEKSAQQDKRGESSGETVSSFKVSSVYSGDNDSSDASKSDSDKTNEPEPENKSYHLSSPLVEKDKFVTSSDVILNEALKDDLFKIASSINETEETVSLKPLNLLPPKDNDRSLEPTADESIMSEIKKGMDMMDRHEYDDSWELFSKLVEKYPESLEANLGFMYLYAADSRWQEAYRAGIFLMYYANRTDDWERYSVTMCRVIINCLKDCSSRSDFKRMLFELGVLHSSYPVTARKFLRLAVDIKCKIIEDSALHYYLLMLEDGAGRFTIDDTVSALSEITVCPEIFDELFSMEKLPQYKVRRPIIKMIESLYMHSKEEAKELESSASGPIRLGPAQVTINDAELMHDEESSMTKYFMLDQLFPRAGFTPPEITDTGRAVIESSKPIPFGFEPAGIFDRLNAKTFNFRPVNEYYYEGAPSFFVESSMNDSGACTFVLHSDLARLSPIEQQFLLLRKSFQMYHQHTTLWYAHQALTPGIICNLLRAAVEICVETGTEVPVNLMTSAKSLDSEDPRAKGKAADIIDRLYRATNRDEFLTLKEFLFAKRPFTATLDRSADKFAAKSVGIVDASYGLVRLYKGFDPCYEEIAKNGFCTLYLNLKPEETYLRRCLQRLWISYFDEDD